MKLLNVDLSFMANALEGDGINAKPKAIHKIGVSRRKKQVEAKVKELEASLTPDADYKVFIKELEDLKKKFADLDDDGKMIEQDIPTKRGPVKVPLLKKRLPEYMESVATLRVKFKDVILATKILNDSYDDLLLTESDIKLAPVMLSDFVEDKTSFIELFGLYPVIKDFNTNSLLKKKVKRKFKVVDIIGEDGNQSGLDSVDNVTIFDKVVFWDFSIILAWNLRAIREKSFKLKLAKEAVELKAKHEMKRIDLCEIYAKKNINGESMRNVNGYVIEDVAEFNSKFDSLKVKNKKVIDAYENFAQSEIEIELVLIPEEVIRDMDDLLEDGSLTLTLEQASVLEYFV